MASRSPRTSEKATLTNGMQSIIYGIKITSNLENVTLTSGMRSST